VCVSVCVSVCVCVCARVCDVPRLCACEREWVRCPEDGVACAWARGPGQDAAGGARAAPQGHARARHARTVDDVEGGARLVGDRARDERLAAAGRAVQQDACLE
jgi:hypothetical protein